MTSGSESTDSRTIEEHDVYSRLQADGSIMEDQHQILGERVIF